jgi:hypothetical protein
MCAKCQESRVQSRAKENRRQHAAGWLPACQFTSKIDLGEHAARKSNNSALDSQHK